MAYAKGPYTSLTSLPVPPSPKIHSARSINFSLRRVEVDEQTGGFLAMPPNSQRVALLISFEVPEAAFITPQEQELTRQRIRKALEPLTGGDAPLIEVVSVSVGSDTSGSSFRKVVFRDLTKNDPDVVQTVQLV